MPRYTVRCPNCGIQELTARMSEAAHHMPCPQCGRPRPQIFHAPQFTQDNLRLWRGPQGNGWSNALGAFMPDNRAERDRLAKARGVDFCSLEDLKRDNPQARDAIEYRNHVDAGGARQEAASPPDPWKERPT